MAAVTVVRKRENVPGSRRQILATVNIASNGDTFATGLKFIEFWSATSISANAIGGTLSGGTITLATGGAETGARIIAQGF